MATLCQSCEVMARYKYWNELPLVKRSFLQRMCGRFHIEVAIPKEFRECFKGELAEWCVLLGPSGNGWRVRVRQNQNSMFFSDGWLNFVRDHGVMLGDSCVFSYSGASTFDVLIFKECGSEREGAHFTHNSSSFPSPVTCSSFLHTQQSNFYEDVLVEEDLYDESKVSMRFEEEQGGEENVVSVSLDFGDQKTSKGKAPRSTEEDDKSSENEDGNEDEKSYKKRGRSSTSQGRKQHQTVYVSRRRVVTEQEIETTHKEATNYVINNESRIPRTQITMLRTHVYQGFHMTLKKDWALAHMCLKDHDVKLRVLGVKGSWIIGCRWTRMPMQCHLGVRWSNFVLDNNLEEHDVCVFELVRRGDPRSKTEALLDVRIFRVVNEVVPLKKVRTFV